MTLELSKPIKEPSVPFLGHLEDGFQEGRMMRIQGFAPPNAQRFNINFQTGSSTSPRDDVSLHLSVRIAEGYIARNSLEAGSWGAEQGQGECPIFPNQHFEIIVLCGSSDYKVAVNGRHFCDFPQRIPASKIRYLAVEGDVALGVISFEGNELSSQDLSGAELKAGMEGMQQPGGGYAGPQQGGYGGQQQGGYGPPPGQYGPPPPGYQGGPGGYGPPGAPPGPPPGHQQESGFESFLDNAGSLIAGAVSSGLADKLIGSLTSGGGGGAAGGAQGQHNQNPYGQAGYPHPQQQPQQEPSFNIPQLGGQGSVGGLGSIGSLLTSFASEILQPKKNRNAIPSAPFAPSAPAFGDGRMMPNLPPTAQRSTAGFKPNGPSGNMVPFTPGSGMPPTYPVDLRGHYPTYPAGNLPTYPAGNLPPYPAGNLPPYPAGNLPPYPAGSVPSAGHRPAGNVPSYPTGNLPPYTPGNVPSYPSLTAGNNPTGNLPPYTAGSRPGLGNMAPHAHPSMPMPSHAINPSYLYGPSVGYPGMTPRYPVARTKKERRKLRKAMKYGLPIVGVGVGAYALSSAVHHHGHKSSSSSSSSSSD